MSTPHSRNVPQANPRANYLAHRDEIDAAISRVLEGGRYILGAEVESFEREFAAFVGVGHAVGVASGTDAVLLALRALGIGAGDAVLTVSHTAVATVAAIELAGATPVFVDIDPATFTMSPDALEAAIKQHTGPPLKAIVVVHLFGHAANMPAIMMIATMNGLRVVEDCAQSHGATVNSQKTGAIGDIGAFSFYPTKNLGAFGDGGAVVTNDAVLATELRLLRQYGWRERYVSDIAGMNSRLDELQAAMLRVKLRYLTEDNARRLAIAERYHSLLKGTALKLPKAQKGFGHVYHQYVVRSKKRNELGAWLASQHIGALVHYPLPVHQQPAYTHLPIANDLRETERAAREVLSLPIFPELTMEQVDIAANAILEFHSKR